MGVQIKKKGPGTVRTIKFDNGNKSSAKKNDKKADKKD